jgi:nucleoside-diphosphate-sugar epimerase
MPTSPKILVTGATGKTNGAVVTLLAKGYPVRATVRVEDARSDLLQRRGAEVVVADIFDLPGINPATYYRAQEQLVPPTPRRRATVSRPRWWCIVR